MIEELKRGFLHNKNVYSYIDTAIYRYIHLCKYVYMFEAKDNSINMLILMICIECFYIVLCLCVKFFSSRKCSLGMRVFHILYLKEMIGVMEQRDTDIDVQGEGANCYS